MYMNIIIHFDTKINILIWNNDSKFLELDLFFDSIESRYSNSSFFIFSRSFCNLKSSSFMAFLDSAKVLTFSETSLWDSVKALTFSETSFTISCKSFKISCWSYSPVSRSTALIPLVRKLVVPYRGG